MKALPVSPKFATIETWLVISGMSRRATYYGLAARELTAIKFGRRTLIDVERSLKWMESHPVAEFRAPPPKQPGEQIAA